MTDTQRRMLAHAIMVAKNATDDLLRAGPRTRPTISQLRRTTERLASIELILKEAMR